MFEKSTSDPLVSMKAEFDRLRAEGDRLFEAGHDEVQIQKERPAIWDRIERTPAVSCAGLIAQLETGEVVTTASLGAASHDDWPGALEPRSDRRLQG